MGGSAPAQARELLARTRQVTVTGPDGVRFVHVCGLRDPTLDGSRGSQWSTTGEEHLLE